MANVGVRAICDEFVVVTDGELEGKVSLEAFVAVDTDQGTREHECQADQALWTVDRESLVYENASREEDEDIPHIQTMCSYGYNFCDVVDMDEYLR